nr:MAG TPA: hypothetical protein [Caudoviricetes sp.]
MSTGKIDLSNRQIKIKTNDDREIIIEKNWWRIINATDGSIELKKVGYGKFEAYFAVFTKLLRSINSGVEFKSDCDRTRISYHPGVKLLVIRSMSVDEDIYLDE